MSHSIGKSNELKSIAESARKPTKQMLIISANRSMSTIHGSMRAKKRIKIKQLILVFFFVVDDDESDR